MRLTKWLQVVLASCAVQAKSTHRDHDRYDYYALHLDSSTNPENIASLLGAELEGPLGELPHHYVFSAQKHQSPDLDASLDELSRLRRKRSVGSVSELDGVLWSQKQVLRQRLKRRVPPPLLDSRQNSPSKSPGANSDQDQQEAIQRLNTIADKLDIKDPIFKEQWHLFNPLQIGHDLNVTGVWLDGITGNGTITAIIDDGLDFESDDLSPNYFAEGSWDYNDPGPDPRPRLSDDRHGTRCAGEIGAARNDICGVGMAYDGQIAGLRILSKQITDEDEAASINYKYQQNQIYSCSWGPPDDGRTMEGPSTLIKKAIVNGVQQGRGGLGSVFVFAAGNGAASDDNCNFDGYTNSIYSISVGGIDRAGNHPYYSESCSALLLVTYSSGHSDAIHTTDVGTNACFSGHGGTSAAGPLVAGAAALALGVRPELSWRDIQYLIVNSALPIHLEDGDWQDTKIGRKFSHMYGYGKMDTWAFIEAAKTHELVKPQAWYNSPWLSVVHPIPEGDQGLASSFDVTKEMLLKANLERLEHVTVTMNIDHARRGDLSVDLKSPEGVISHIATARRSDDYRGGYNDWAFMSVAHWGESGVGTWTIIVKDNLVNQRNGTFIDWRLNFWGESIDASIQGLHPLPDDHEDDHETATAPVATTSVNPNPPATDLPTVPSDHIDRPTKPKPDETTSPSITDIPPSSTPTATVTATATDTSTTPTSTSSSFLPDVFPTFGATRRTQIWIYGSFALIVTFCICLGVYFLIQRRKRLRNEGRDDYEFEMIDDDDADEAKQGLTGKRRKKRGGELYDAFAGESDEDVFSDDNDDEDRYEDTPSGSGSGDGDGRSDHK